MNNQQYNDLKELIEVKFDFNKKEHERIYEQTKLTNSRVTKLEFWRNRILGGMAVISAVVLPIIIWLIKANI